MYKIIATDTEEMVEIVAELVKRHITLKAYKENGNWTIECTGGY